MTGTTKLDLQVDGTTAKRRARLKNETLKSEQGRQSAAGGDSWHLESAATSSLYEKGASNLPESCRNVRDATRRESER